MPKRIPRQSGFTSIPVTRKQMIRIAQQHGTGEQGPQGPQGVAGPQGPAGDAGSNGSDGADGLSVLNGSGAPSGGTGSDGDFYIDTSANEIYGPKSGTWGSGTSLVGPQGATGAQGAQGIQGIQGIQGDTGATGAQGPQGDQGAQGDTGATGATGPEGPQGPQGPAASPSATTILSGTASASGNNIHGAKGTVVALSWDATTNNATYVDTFSNGDTEIQFVGAEEISVHASVGAIDNGVNNRSTYVLRLRHVNSSDTEIFTYYLDDTYVRDDNNTYDSGLMAAELRLFVAAGDKVIIQTEVLDVQTTTGTVNASTSYSKIKIDRISY